MKRLALTTFILTIVFALNSVAHSSTIVNFEGTDYHVTVMFGEFADFQTEIQNSPWWGDSSDAIFFAEQVDDDLGQTNALDGFGIFGPFFAYSLFMDFAVDVATCSEFNPCNSGTLLGVDDVSDMDVEEWWYAKATVVPVPATAWLFMSGLIGLVWKGRKARQAAA